MIRIKIEDLRINAALMDIYNLRYIRIEIFFNLTFFGLIFINTEAKWTI